MALYQQWLADKRGLRFDSYDAMWQWSTTDLAAFWASIWDYFDIQSPTTYTQVIGEAVMPGARWFVGAQVNYTQQVLRHAAAAHAAGHPAIVFQNEAMVAAGLPPTEIPWPELQRQVLNFAAHLRQAGVVPGDRVCAYLPNVPQTVVAFLACAAVGAVWSVCSPDMGPVAVLDRFTQIAPKVLIAVDSQLWGGVRHDRSAVLQQVLANLPSVAHVVMVGEALSALAQTLPKHLTMQVHSFNSWVAAVARASRNGCLLITRCGWCTAAAPRACPKPWCTAMAA
jgi:acetoacetyl-CoA synthetase